MIEARLDISLYKPVDGGPFPANFSQGRMATSGRAKAVAGFMKVGSVWAVIDAFENDMDDLLHDFIARGGNP